jgi:hypothetical protein
MARNTVGLVGHWDVVAFASHALHGFQNFITLLGQ